MNWKHGPSLNDFHVKFLNDVVADIQTFLNLGACYRALRVGMTSRSCCLHWYNCAWSRSIPNRFLKYDSVEREKPQANTKNDHQASNKHMLNTKTRSTSDSEYLKFPIFLTPEASSASMTQASIRSSPQFHVASSGFQDILPPGSSVPNLPSLAVPFARVAIAIRF